MAAAVPTIKLMVLGGHKVGKSALTVRYLTKRFIGEYTSESDLLYNVKATVDGDKVDLQVLDCADRQKTEPCDTIVERQIHWGDAFVVVYSVCDRDAFHQIPHLVRQICSIRATQPPILVLGNKTDLGRGRVVTLDEGQDVAQEHGCQFYEVSAAEGLPQVTHAFNELLREAKAVQIYSTAQKRKPRRRSSVKKFMSTVFGISRRNSITLNRRVNVVSLP